MENHKVTEWGVVSLAELGVNGQNLGVAHEGESQDGDGVRRLQRNTSIHDF